MKYNPAIHNRRSVRLKGYDYSQEGAYFITICCKNRAHVFGEIINGEMILNANGIVAYNEWLKTSEIRSNVELDVFIIMPNHIHGIIIINNRMVDNGRGVLHTPDNVFHKPDNVFHKPDNIFHKPDNNQSSIIQQGVYNTPLRSPSNTIGAMVRGYKSAVTKQLNEMALGNYKQSATIWQRNFHDHIIGNSESYLTISNYILTNPSKWDEDRYR